MTIYDEPGKARKQCPACKKYIHARSTVCPACDHEFKPGAKEARQAKPIDRTKEGRGRKQCPGCMNYVGVRTQVCACGNDFSVSGSVVKEQEKSKEHQEALELMAAIGYNGMNILYTPAGKCPVKLSKTDKNSVAKWCEDILNHFLLLRYFPAIQCYRYFVRKHDFNKEDMQKAFNGIEAWKKQYLDSYAPIEYQPDWNSISELV